MHRRISFEETGKQAHTPEQLARWGVNYPPRRGWRIALSRGEDPNSPPAKQPRTMAVTA